MSKKEMRAMFITNCFRIDNNNSNSLVQKGNYTYGSQGDCSQCCVRILVRTR